MLNKTYFTYLMKKSSLCQLIITGILLVYAWVILLLFDPQMAASLNQMLEAMPELFSAFGMVSLGPTLLDFIRQYLFGFLLLLLPALFSLWVTTQFIGKPIDRGSMANILAAPLSRKKVIFTTWVVGLLQLLIMLLVIGASLAILSQVYFPNQLDTEGLMRLMVGLAALHFALYSLFFCIACWFNDSGIILALNSGLLLVFYLVQMMANMNGSMEFVRYFTLFTLFDSAALVVSFQEAAVSLAVLLLIGVLATLVGVSIFQKKDLSL